MKKTIKDIHLTIMTLLKNKGVNHPYYVEAYGTPYSSRIIFEDDEIGMKNMNTVKKIINESWLVRHIEIEVLVRTMYDEVLDRDVITLITKESK